MAIMDNLFAADSQSISIDRVGSFNGVQLDMLRLDKLDVTVSGNKWFKLYYNIKQATASSASILISFGGPWSNHLVALAAAANMCGLQSIGIVRGKQGGELTATLAECAALGMQLQFVDRAEYARKYDSDYQQYLQSQFPNSIVIPEGGNNELGRVGAALISSYIPVRYTHVCVSVGTGTTFAGIRRTLPVDQHLIGFAPMKNGCYLQEEISEAIPVNQNQNWLLTDKYHFGGFGKINDELQSFMTAFEGQYNIPLDRVYTAKMMLGILEMIKAGDFPQDACVLSIHTGGLQGNRSL